MKVNNIKKRLPPYNDKSSLSIPSRQNLPVYKKIRTMSQKHYIPASYDRITENRYL